MGIAIDPEENDDVILYYPHRSDTGPRESWLANTCTCFYRRVQFAKLPLPHIHPAACQNKEDQRHAR